MKFIQNFSKKFSSILRKLHRSIFIDLVLILYLLFFISIKPKRIRYNLDKSPSTFGDFTYFILVVCFLAQKKDFEVDLVYSKNLDKNYKWNYLTSKQIKKRILNLHNYGNQLITKLSPQLTLKLNLVEVGELDTNRRSYHELDYIVATKLAKLIWQFSKFPKDGKETIPYFKKNIAVKNNLIKSPYFAIVVRFDKRKTGTIWYNSSKFFILNLIKLLREFKNTPIFIVSDPNGCKFAREILLNIKDIYFSDAYGGHSESVDILINASLVVQKDAGGICVPVLFSKTNYIMSMWPGNLKIFNSVGMNKKSQYLQIFYRRKTDREFLHDIKILIDAYGNQII